MPTRTQPMRAPSPRGCLDNPARTAPADAPTNAHPVNTHPSSMCAATRIQKPAKLDAFGVVATPDCRIPLGAVTSSGSDGTTSDGAGGSARPQDEQYFAPSGFACPQ